ncbi:nuclear GTPase SLIP-GC [Cercophora samala]|uniref:Nuclear GTPase SLIP-GC n=1 Tax=Cercophora samala TaxID=330535 RepID=A0AA39ZDY3_9PEZI|nr:nuclear GTPase SLIP-GC [Cercophora samala]
MAGVKHEPENNPGAAQGYLKRLINESAPERLEAGVAVGVKQLEILKAPLLEVLPVGTTQAPQWIKSIEELERLAKPTRTIVGVVGNTGAGKSSVISAVLDEERLLPTNCMRACTASPTEISYNYSDDPLELYRAEVDFITADDWLRDLRALFSDLLDGNGEVSRESSNQDSDAGIAYAKIKAVYPQKTKESMALSSPEDMVKEPAIARVLGTTKKLRATTSAALYRLLQEYVDSREKNSEKKIEYWPLIKVVRIYTKAAALSTGACLVDLPGVQDSNAARAAVAANYMKACTGLWIVAPITRAVDDKTAKSLLGDSFRRQLKYDGTYSAVTFICSKTDDISETEAADSLGITDDLAPSWRKIDELEDNVRDIKKQMADLKDEKKACQELTEQVNDEWDRWYELKEQLDKGNTVYAPGPPDSPGKKRKRQSTSSPEKRRKRKSPDFDDSDFSASEGSDGDSDKENEDEFQESEDRPPLTKEQIDEKMKSLRDEKKDIRERKKNIEEKERDFRGQIKAYNAEKEALMDEIRNICIQGRNEYSRGAIKQDFAMGIKELDQENAAEEDEDNFDPDVDIRDYDAVAKSLPVFCVSSRAFQKLSGRLQRDRNSSSGFLSLDDTEVPQLQAHAKKLTEAGRAANARRFLNSLTQLMNSMTMWATNDGTRSNLTDKEKRQEDTRIRNQLNKLEQDLETALQKCYADMGRQLYENIYANFDKFIPDAAQLAPQTATGWGAPRDMGGLVWATYKATCRRYGVYTGAAGPKDFNAELFDPISRQLPSGWERAFQRRLPDCLNAFVARFKAVLREFHAEAIKRAVDRSNNYHGVTMLGQQLETHSQGLIDIATQAITTIQERQRDASRSFEPVIQDQMRPAYDGCTEERGPGSYKRMKALMIDHVTRNQEVMFRTATGNVQQALDGMCKEIRQQLEDCIAEKHASIMRDYLAVLIGAEAAEHKGLPRMERMLRAEMVPLLAGIDEAFKILYEKPPAKPEPAQAEPAVSKIEAAQTGPVVNDASQDTSVKNETFSDASAVQEGHAVADDSNEEMQDAPAVGEHQLEDRKPLLEELEQQGSDLAPANPGATVADDSAFIKPEPEVY